MLLRISQPFSDCLAGSSSSSNPVSVQEHPEMRIGQAAMSLSILDWVVQPGLSLNWLQLLWTFEEQSGNRRLLTIFPCLPFKQKKKWNFTKIKFQKTPSRQSYKSKLKHSHLPNWNFLQLQLPKLLIQQTATIRQTPQQLACPETASFPSEQLA